ncbi:MAG: biopolymer transporter ExbD [Planctomycetota bacterium]|nr:MAG: biopolymer transporter ExbD [Planctomycetota bacterium]
MRRLRRLDTTTRIELTPMIDVVFLLLTFFVFAIVLMVRADILGVSLPELTAGTPAQRVEPITITLLADGSLALMGDPIEADALTESLRTLRADNPDAPVLIASDVAADAGALIELADRLVAAGITQFSVVGRARNRQADPPPMQEHAAP